MLKFLVSKGQGLSLIDGLDKDSEIMELEKQATDEVRTPEDMMAFIVSLGGLSNLSFKLSIYGTSCGSA